MSQPKAYAGRPPEVTLLTPVYNEEQSLPAYVEAVRHVLMSRDDLRVRVLFVDDGSSDRSWGLLKQLCEKDARFQALRLSRNFGAHIAISAGLDHSFGDAVAILACDLQDPPEVVLEFVTRWQAGAKIVWGQRRSRQDKWWRVWASSVFFWLLKRYALPHGSKFTTGSFLLADRQVVECLRQFREHNRVTFALVAFTGFEQDVVLYDRQKRKAGVSGWPFSQMMKTLYDTFLGFSVVPMRFTTRIGLVISLLTIPLILWLVVGWATGQPLRGYTSLMVGMAFFFGIQFLLMGLWGEYLHRIYSESVRRPLYFIAERQGEANESQGKAT